MRLFIAICFPEDVKRAILKAERALETAGVRGNFTDAANLHLTLAFLGEVKPEAVEKVHSAMASVPFDPFSLTLAEGGRFGNLIWIGLRENDALSSYVSALRNALKVREVWYDPKPFKPHITLIRKAQNAREIPIKAPGMTFTARRVSLMKSERVDGRLVYTEIDAVQP